ncbi:MAG: Crp/Fnr family transcriptional regulator [Thermosynechococcaceae cyanobacterium]
MAKRIQQSVSTFDDVAARLQQNFLFRDCSADQLVDGLSEVQSLQEKLYSGRPIYTAYEPDIALEYLYTLVHGGPVIVRSAPLDRVIALTYPGGCFGMFDLDCGDGLVYRGFPSLVEAYKTADVIKIPQAVVQRLYQENAAFQQRYRLLLELREKFQYHLLNCSTYPPQAVAALLRALIYQERILGNQPKVDGIFCFDLSVDIIARACQLNHRTVEQVLKGMTKVGLLQKNSQPEVSGDRIEVCDPEGLKGVYGATRDKVAWWPLR